MNNSDFKNTYFILRHGESMPNSRGIIVSDLSEGKKQEHALTQDGESQVSRSVTEAKKVGILDQGTVIYSSPFSRCKKTAEIAKDILEVQSMIIFDDRLRERWFGDWDGTSNANYQKVWDGDINDAHHKYGNVESVEEVMARVAGLIHDLENSYSHKNILLVSHGDVLQILQTFFENKPSSAHRDIHHLTVAELRRVN